MNNNNNNQNLRNKINHHQASILYMHRQGFSDNYIAGATIHHEAQIRALRRELNRRAAIRRNKAKGHWKTLGKHVRARGVVGYLQRQTMRPPTRGGAGYQRLLRQTNLGKKRTRSVGTSISPRRSPKRRNTSASPRR